MILSCSPFIEIWTRGPLVRIHPVHLGALCCITSRDSMLWQIWFNKLGLPILGHNRNIAAIESIEGIKVMNWLCYTSNALLPQLLLRKQPCMSTPLRLQHALRSPETRSSPQYFKTSKLAPFQRNITKKLYIIQNKWKKRYWQYHIVLSTVTDWRTLRIAILQTFICILHQSLL